LQTRKWWFYFQRWNPKTDKKWSSPKVLPSIFKRSKWKDICSGLII